MLLYFIKDYIKNVNMLGRMEKLSYICGVKKYTKEKTPLLSQAMEFSLLTLKTFNYEKL